MKKSKNNPKPPEPEFDSAVLFFIILCSFTGSSIGFLLGCLIGETSVGMFIGGAIGLYLGYKNS